MKKIQMFPDKNKTHCARVIFSLLVIAVVFASTSKPLAAQSAFQVLHVFNKAGDGQAPMAGVQADPAGNLFGSAEFGGANGFGAIFMLKPPAAGKTNWTEKVIFSFADGNDGGFPSSPLVVASNDDLVSSTLMGGTANNGTIFRLSPPTSSNGPWIEKVLENFQGQNSGDGSGPLGSLLNQNGTTFGTTSFGGTSNCGTAYKLTPASGGTFEETVIFHFACGADGGQPQIGVIADGKGNFFGTTETDGEFNNGVVFQLTPPSDGSNNFRETPIFAFNVTDGAQPVANLLEFKGSLYGVTFQGGQFGQGVVFQLTPPAQSGGSWTEVVLHDFSGGTDGGEPQTGLVADGSGGFFGTASQGGATGNGNFFHLVPPAAQGGTWTLTPLHQFAGGNDGSDPIGELLKRGNTVFGTTQGSVSGSATVYKIVP
ncbi:MAG TPA: choice-of-anchor tandem repeat GloVer-containing protein [Candidatus Sulfotelmatobacter sp.]|jgi:uncharacterized repeat protein (TIGR03803 family)